MRSSLYLPKHLLSQLCEISVAFEKRRVVWAIFAGAAASIYGAKRSVNDLDLIVRERDLWEVASYFHLQLMAFENKFQSATIRTQLLRFGFCEVTARLLIETSMGNYEFALDNLMIKRRRWFRVNGLRVPVLSPEDNVVFKGIMQRGNEDKKHDLEDIKDILKNQKIDKDYLRVRIKISRSEKRLSRILDCFYLLDHPSSESRV